MQSERDFASIRLSERVDLANSLLLFQSHPRQILIKLKK
jgi:hypothetical protein